MPLILAIEPDKRQSSQLANVVKGLHAELVLRPNAADALGALNGRVPDLVLTTSLISPRDDAALATHLRELGPAAAHVQTVTIPVLGSAAAKPAKIGGMLAALRREKPQAPMTDGCAPEVFAEQVRQYLATAEEQKAVAATRATVAATVADTMAEPVLVEDAVTEAAFADEFLAPVDEIVTPAVEPEPVLVEAAAEPEPAYDPPLCTPPIEAPLAHAIEEPAVAEIAMEAAAPEALVVDEPTSVPLSQLLEFVSAASPAIVEEPAAEAPIPEPVVQPEVFVEAASIVEAAPVIEASPELEAQPASSFGELYVDPMAAEALEELSRQAPPVSLSDGIPAEAPVPVVEMHSFQSLDAIASELAAGPTQRRESLEDLASFFAATPAAPAPPAPVNEFSGPVVDFSAPAQGENDLFASLFAKPAPARAPKPADIPSIDSSLFASPAPEPVVAFEAPPAVVVEPEPEPEPVLATAPEPEQTTAAPEPEPEPEPVVAELAAAPAVEETVVAEPVVAEPVVAERVVAEPLVEEAVVEEAAAEDELLTFEPVVFEPVVVEPPAVAAAPEPDFDEEISLDVDAFQYTPPAPAAPAEPARFSFTLVDGGFGDAMSDFEVPSAAAVAADLGVGEHLPLDPYASKPAPPSAAMREALNHPAAAPALDEEALSLIGDAAHKVGLDALVIEEFARGLNQPRPKKAKKKVHAGATQVPAAPAPAPKPAKRPVQDEWGMFDPEQCGFAALEEEEGAETRPTTGTRVRVISY